MFVAGALLALTALTYWAAFIDLGPFKAAARFGIAAVKATLSVLVFMHARQSSGLTRLIIAVEIVWLALLIVGSLDDYDTRSWLPIPGQQPARPSAGAVPPAGRRPTTDSVAR